MMIWIIYLGIMDTLRRGKCSKSFHECLTWKLPLLSCKTPEIKFPSKCLLKTAFQCRSIIDGNSLIFFLNRFSFFRRKWNSGYQWQSTMALRKHSRQAAKGGFRLAVWDNGAEVSWESRFSSHFPTWNSSFVMSQNTGVAGKCRM